MLTTDSINHTRPDLPDSDLRLESALISTRRELDEAGNAIQTYWLQDAAGDSGRNALEALLRCVANLTLSVERMDERLTNEIIRRRTLSARLDTHEIGGA